MSEPKTKVCSKCGQTQLLDVSRPTCEECGGPCPPRPTWSRFGKFCKTACRVKNFKRMRIEAKKIGRTCQVCGVNIEHKRSDAVTCDESCKRKRQNHLRSGGSQFDEYNARRRRELAGTAEEKLRP